MRDGNCYSLVLPSAAEIEISSLHEEVSPDLIESTSVLNHALVTVSP